MARRSNRTEHLPGKRTYIGERVINEGTPEEKLVKQWRLEALCNDKYGSTTVYSETQTPSYGYTTLAWSVKCCTACQSKFYAKQIREMSPPFRFKMADRLDMSTATYDQKIYGMNKYAFKSVYPVIDTHVLGEGDERIVGFICIDNGFGKSWEVHGWGAQTDRNDEKIEMVCQATETIRYIEPPLYEGAEPKTYESDAKRFGSKEAALLAFPAMVEQGKLPTYMAVLEGARSRLESRKREEIERQQRRQEQERAREDARLAAQNKREALLTDIRDALFNSEPPMANFARDVLIRTALAAGYTQEELDEAFSIEEPAPVAAGEPETDEWGEVIVRGA